MPQRQSSPATLLWLTIDETPRACGLGVVCMPDPLHFSLWFPRFETIQVLPRAVSVMAQFPFSQHRPGISYLAVHPVSWAEATVLERRFVPEVSPDVAAGIASDLLHDDYAYVFEAHWDLWSPIPGSGAWERQPSPVRFVVQGRDFEAAELERADIEIDLGLDSPFLAEELQLSTANETHIQENLGKLVAFTAALEKRSGASARLLWSESDENLAQKLISRLQKVQ